MFQGYIVQLRDWEFEIQWWWSFRPIVECEFSIVSSCPCYRIVMGHPNRRGWGRCSVHNPEHLSSSLCGFMISSTSIDRAIWDYTKNSLDGSHAWSLYALRQCSTCKKGTGGQQQAVIWGSGTGRVIMGNWWTGGGIISSPRQFDHCLSELISPRDIPEQTIALY